MIKYLELMKRHQKDISEFPFMFAFSKEQFAEGMVKLGLKESDIDKIYYVKNCDCYIRKSDSEKMHQMFKRHSEEFKKAIEEDETGDNFIYEMFNYELANHEYSVSYDLIDTLKALGLTIEEINSNEKLLHGLTRAIDNQKYNS